MEAKILDAKMTYNEALRNLEMISEEIHKIRQMTGEKLEEFNLGDEMKVADAATLQISSNQLESTGDEYLVFPKLDFSLKTNASSEKQKLFREYNLGASGSKFGCEDSDGDNAISPNQTDMVRFHLFLFIVLSNFKFSYNMYSIHWVYGHETQCILYMYS